MRTIMKRSMALLMAFAICVSLLPVTHAAAAHVEYVYDSANGYIYNWGNRGETATFLSPNAQAFYADGKSYDELSVYAVSDDTSAVHTSELFTALYELMAENHTIGAMLL